MQATIITFYLGNTLNEDRFKLLITEAIKKRETFILDKHSMEIKVDSRIAEALNSSSMLSSNINNILNFIAQKGRSHLLLRDKEEEKTMKGLKKISERNQQRYNQMWEENEYLKAEIEKLGDEIDRKRNKSKDDEKNRELLSDLYEKGIIDENGNIIEYDNK